MGKKKFSSKGVSLKVNGKEVDGFAKDTEVKPLWHFPRHKIIAIAVSQAIYHMRIEAQADRAMIDAYSK